MPRTVTKGPRWSRSPSYFRGARTMREAATQLKHWSRAQHVDPSQTSRELTGEREGAIPRSFEIVREATMQGKVEVPYYIAALWLEHRQALVHILDNRLVRRFNTRRIRENPAEGWENEAGVLFDMRMLELPELLLAHRREFGIIAGLLADGEELLARGIDPRELI